MLLRSGFAYNHSAPLSTTSTRSSRKRKSVDDELDERPLKRQDTTPVLQGEPSGSSHPAPLVSSPSLSSFPPSSSSSPVPEAPFAREDSCASDATVPVDDVSSEETVALEDEPSGNERGYRRVHFGSSVIEYLFEADDEPQRVVELKHFAFLRDAEDSCIIWFSKMSRATSKVNNRYGVNDAIFTIRVKGVELDDLIDGFKQILEMEGEVFYQWLDLRYVELSILFTEHVIASRERTQLYIQDNKFTARRHSKATLSDAATS